MVSVIYATQSKKSFEKIGEVIKEFRLRRGYGQRILGERVGVDHTYISKIENGKSVPSFEMLGKLFEALDLEVSIHERQEEKENGDN